MALDIEQAASMAAFDALAELLCEREGRPAQLRDVSLRSVTAFQRALLALDGTVTKFIEAYTMEPVKVGVLWQTARRLETEHAALQAQAGSEVVAREVLLRGQDSGRVYAYAVSLLLPERLPPDALTRLAAEPAGLGRMLANGSIENRRELLWYGREQLAALAPEILEHTGEQFLSRAYRILIGGRPAMLIVEKFPANLADSVPSDEDEPMHRLHQRPNT